MSNHDPTPIDDHASHGLELRTQDGRALVVALSMPIEDLSEEDIYALREALLRKWMRLR